MGSMFIVHLQILSASQHLAKHYMGNKKITTISRRKFVKRTSLGAGSLILAGTLPVERSAWVQGNETLKLALIGCGGRGTGAANHALLADKDVKLVAMADIFRDRLDTSYDSLSQRHDRTRLDVPEEHKFTGFDSYKRAIESEEHTSELQSRGHLVCRLLLEKNNVS